MSGSQFVPQQGNNFATTGAQNLTDGVNAIRNGAIPNPLTTTAQVATAGVNGARHGIGAGAQWAGGKIKGAFNAEVHAGKALVRAGLNLDKKLIGGALNAGKSLINGEAHLAGKAIGGIGNAASKVGNALKHFHL
jgi:hypothetical protein